jgi:ring-1,2-phenylacetyl-CoA epoxidase subunit PaaE
MAFRTRASGGRVEALTVSKVSRLTSDSVAVEFTVPPEFEDAYRHTPGQHVTILHAYAEGVARRPYSICSLPGEGLRIGVKEIEGGVFSTFANRELKPGAVLQVMAPSGSFVAPAADPSAAKRYALVAAGSGITPLLSIGASILAGEPRSSVVLFYANRTRESVMFADELERLTQTYGDRLAVWHFLSREETDGPNVRNQRLRVDAIREIADLRRIDDWFLCAPEEFVQELTDALAASGVPDEHVHRELFFSDAAPVNADLRPQLVASVEVRAGDSTTTFELDSRGESILAKGLEAGADLPYACTQGVCSTCKAKVVAGEVAMDRDSGLDRREAAAGYVLTCQAHPVSPSVVLDFQA